MKKLILIIVAVVIISNYSNFETKNYQSILNEYINFDKVQEKLLNEEYFRLEEAILSDDNNISILINNDNKNEKQITNKEDNMINENISEKNIDIFVDNTKDINLALSEVEMLKLLKDNLNLVNLNDKLILTSIAIKNFTIDEFNDWKYKASDGLSDIEREELKELMYNRLSGDELTEIKELANKYQTLLAENNQDAINVMADYISQE